MESGGLQGLTLHRELNRQLRHAVSGRNRPNKPRVHQFVSQCQMVTVFNVQTLQRENSASLPPLSSSPHPPCVWACVRVHILFNWCWGLSPGLTAGCTSTLPQNHPFFITFYFEQCGVVLRQQTPTKLPSLALISLYYSTEVFEFRIPLPCPPEQLI